MQIEVADVDSYPRLSTASSEHTSCQSCGLCLRKGVQTPFMLPYRPPGWTGSLLIIGEAPGREEDEDGRPFVGRSGKLLRTLWRAAGYDDSDVALVNAVRGRPRDNATPSMSQLRACRPWLIRAVLSLGPKSVVLVGASAAKAVLDRGNVNVTATRGRLLRLGEIPVRVTYHPSAVLRGATHLKRRIVEDLERARGKEPEAPAILTEGFPLDKVISVDTEYDPNHRILTIAVAGRQSARAWDVGDGIAGA